MGKKDNHKVHEGGQSYSTIDAVSDYWIKIVDFLQHNWATIEPTEDGCVVYFFTDHSEVFDTLEFTSVNYAMGALSHNGFRLYDDEYSDWIAAPEPPLRVRGVARSRPIYSSGEYWRSSYGIKHFLSAQRDLFPAVLEELKDGRKRTHWMWLVFPQVKGLGRSSIARRYSIKSLSQALDFVNDPVLGSRLRECCEALLALEETNARNVLGQPDDLKLRSSMTLFSEITNNKIFGDVLDKYYRGQRDLKTLSITDHWHRNYFALKDSQGGLISTDRH